MHPASRLEISSLILADDVAHSSDLEVLLATLQARARRRHVRTVHARVTLGGALTFAVEVQDKGARLRVPGRGLYACTVDGLLNAAADVIREEHGSSSELLDVYQTLLGG